MEFTKLAHKLESKGSKILHNLQTMWISLLSHAKHVLSKYCSLVAKHGWEACSCHATTKVKATLLDVEVMLGLACLIPMFLCVHALMKLAQARDYVFMISSLM